MLLHNVVLYHFMIAEVDVVLNIHFLKHTMSNIFPNLSFNLAQNVALYHFMIAEVGAVLNIHYYPVIVSQPTHF